LETIVKNFILAVYCYRYRTIIKLQILLGSVQFIKSNLHTLQYSYTYMYILITHMGTSPYHKAYMIECMAIIRRR
jgi:hypothetical protein